MPKSEKATKKQRGRPTRHAGGKLSKNRTFKIYPDLDAKLIAAAAETGRTVSEEIERRLSRSFETEEALGSGINAEFFFIMAAARARKKAREEMLKNDVDPHRVFRPAGLEQVSAAGVAAFIAAAGVVDDILSVTIEVGDEFDNPRGRLAVIADKTAPGIQRLPGPFKASGLEQQLATDEDQLAALMRLLAEGAGLHKSPSLEDDQ